MPSFIAHYFTTYLSCVFMLACLMVTPLSKAVIKRAAHLGFTPPRVVDLSTFGAKAGEGLKAYIEKGHHGTMEWMVETQERRSHPKTLWPEARSAIVLGLNYGPEIDPLPDLFYRLQRLPHPSPRLIIAALVGPVWIFVRPRPFPRLIRLMRGAVFPI